jgi:hypothetical protein
LRSERWRVAWLVGLAVAFLPSLTRAVEAPAAATLRTDGALPKSGTLGRSDLEQLGSTTVAWTTHGQTHQVTGVRVDKVLAHFGFTPGQMGKDVPVREKVRGFRQALIATARDGYQAVFSCAEVSDGMGTTVALVVWEVDGRALGSETGPLRLVVLTDGQPSRSIRQLERLRVVDVSN